VKFVLNSKNIRLMLMGGLALSIVVFLAIAYFGLSVLSGKSQSMVNLKAQSQAAENELASLEQTKKQVQKYAYFKDVAKTVIPNDKDQAAAVLEISQMANDTGINLQSITFPASTLGLSAATTTTQDATSSSAKSTAITQAKPVTGIPGLYSLELTITPDTSNNLPPDRQVTYAKMLDFLNRIENNRHTAQITQVTIDTGVGGNPNALGFNLVVNIFIKP
jgi:cell division protein FtsB